MQQFLVQRLYTGNKNYDKQKQVTIENNDVALAMKQTLDKLLEDTQQLK